LLRIVEADEQRLAALRAVLQDAKGRESPAARRASTLEAAPQERATEKPRRAEAGTLTGTVKVTGTKSALAYVFVETIPARMAQNKTVQIKQVDKKFVPAVAVVQKGTRVEFPNVDKIFHNVFSLTPGSTFDLGSYGANDKPGAYVFTQLGAVDIFCNLHAQMAASILVVPNAYWVKVNDDGRYELKNVPAGRHKVVAWSPHVSPVSQWITVSPGAAASLDFTVEGIDGVPEHTDKKGLPYGSYR
jgi:plastocyanin